MLIFFFSRSQRVFVDIQFERCVYGENAIRSRSTVLKKLRARIERAKPALCVELTKIKLRLIAILTPYVWNCLQFSFIAIIIIFVDENYRC